MQRTTVWQRIQRRIEIDPATGCHLWRGALSQGYARLWDGLKLVYGHRGLWMELHGPLERHEFVCHRCDRPSCCNPDHLFVGSPADNVADMTLKGRQARGEMLPQAKLTAEQVRLIRLDDRPQRSIAAAHGISQTQVSMIKRRERWAHVS